MDPETFSSEFRGLQERRPADRDSFNEEFRGASDSLIAKDRPELVGGRGRGAVVLMAVTLMLPVLIGGGLALWYWAVPIGHWLAGDAPRAEPAVEAEPEADEVAPPTPEPAPAPEVEKVFGIRGVPDGEADPTPEPAQPDAPVQPPDPPVQPNPPVQPPVQPNPSNSKLEAVSTNVRGNVGSTAVNASLDQLDAALLDCWAKAGAGGSIELELSFGITRDGTLHAIALGGGSEALHACVRATLPMSGWPAPQAGGEASVSRTWKLGG